MLHLLSEICRTITFVQSTSKHYVIFVQSYVMYTINIKVNSLTKKTEPPPQPSGTEFWKHFFLAINSPTMSFKVSVM